jgi:hypothetical protein
VYVRFRDAALNDSPDVAGDTILLAEAAPSVQSTVPGNAASNVAVNANINIVFDEPVSVNGGWFQLACTKSGLRTIADAVASGGPTQWAIDLKTDLAKGETCTATIFANLVADQDAVDPPDGLAADHVWSFTVTEAGQQEQSLYLPLIAK